MAETGERTAVVVAHLLTDMDTKGFHFDANAALLVAGREGEPGHDRAAELTISFAHRIKGPLAFNGEFYGDTRLNAETPGFASALWAVIYTVSPRLVLDAGMDFGLTSGPPRKHVFFGVTYSIAESMRP